MLPFNSLGHIKPSQAKVSTSCFWRSPAPCSSLAQWLAQWLAQCVCRKGPLSPQAFQCGPSPGLRFIRYIRFLPSHRSWCCCFTSTQCSESASLPRRSPRSFHAPSMLPRCSLDAPSMLPRCYRWPTRVWASTARPREMKTCASTQARKRRSSGQLPHLLQRRELRSKLRIEMN